MELRLIKNLKNNFESFNRSSEDFSDDLDRKLF